MRRASLGLRLVSGWSSFTLSRLGLLMMVFPVASLCAGMSPANVKMCNLRACLGSVVFGDFGFRA